MSQVEIRKVNQDELSLLQKIAIQTFRETFAFDNTAEQLQNFFDEAYTLSALKLELDNALLEFPPSHFFSTSFNSLSPFELGQLSNRAGTRRCI